MPDGSNFDDLVKKQSPLDSMTAAQLFAEAHGYRVEADDNGRPRIYRGNKLIGGSVPRIHGDGFATMAYD